MGGHNVHKEIKTNVCLWLKIEKSALSSAGSELYLVSPPCPSISRIRCLLSGCQQDTVLLSILQVQAQTGFSMNYNACRNTSASHCMLEAVFESFSMNMFVHVTTSSADHSVSKENGNSLVFRFLFYRGYEYVQDQLQPKQQLHYIVQCCLARPLHTALALCQH